VSRGKPAPYLPRGTAMPCRVMDPLLGKTIPGRHAGLVRGCAVPERPANPKRPENFEPRVQFGFPGIGPTMRRSTARDRLRATARGGVVADDLVGVASASAALLGRTPVLPYPPGVEYPHRRGGSVCDPDHPLWRGLEGDIEAAREEASMRVGEDASEAEFEGQVVELLEASHPEYGFAARNCARGFGEREAARAPSAAGSTVRERAQARAAFVARRGDTGSAEYVDDILGPLRGRARPTSTGRSAPRATGAPVLVSMMAPLPVARSAPSRSTPARPEQVTIVLKRAAWLNHRRHLLDGVGLPFYRQWQPVEGNRVLVVEPSPDVTRVQKFIASQGGEAKLMLRRADTR